MKLGIFGGTFDPVHHGHLIVAEYVREKVGLDRVLLVPSFISPHKQEEAVSEVEDRLAMLREAVGPKSRLEISEIELRRGGVSYTVDTLRELSASHPADRLFLLLGSDNVREFHTWKDPAEIGRLARLIVLTRPGHEWIPSESSLLVGAIFCDVPGIDISSTEIRRRVSLGLPIALMVPPGVERYIVEHRLYTRPAQ
ncbi:MAG: nicotinate-nucleotide adenylyltransferase [Bacteroidota bacterium]